MSTRETKVVQLRSRWLAVSLAAMACAFQAQPARALHEASGAAPGLSVQSSGATAVVPFKIHVPDAVLTDLKDRIARMRYPDEIEGAGWDYGTNLAYLKELTTYWHDKFDWREQERRLNQFEQFKTNIDGLDIHFVHRRAKRPNALPLLVVHGWPGSFMQFHKIIGPLTDPAASGGRAADAFDVVVPSIPGYGFSDRPRERGYNPRKMAEIFVKLMARLGYSRYGVQASDFGAPIIFAMTTIDAAHIVALHTESCRSGPPLGAGDPTAGVPPSEMQRMRERQAFFSDEEQAYNKIQGTKPQTLGYALNDSPVGLAAWIVEKFRAWSDVDGHVEKKFTKDELLTNITIYWVTQTANSAGRLYYEARHGAGATTGAAAPAQQPRTEVPTACVSWPKDVGFAAQMDGGAVQREAVHAHAARRPLRRVRGAAALHRRCARILQGLSLGKTRHWTGACYARQHQGALARRMALQRFGPGGPGGSANELSTSSGSLFPSWQAYSSIS